MEVMGIVVKQLYDKTMAMSKSERVLRVIELTIKQEQDVLDIEEMMELACIQTIRDILGELDEVRRGREKNA